MGNIICSEISNRKIKPKNQTNEIIQFKSVNSENLENLSRDISENNNKSTKAENNSQNSNKKTNKKQIKI